MLMCLVDKKASQIRVHSTVYNVSFVGYLFLRFHHDVLSHSSVGEADQTGLMLGSEQTMCPYDKL